MTKHSRRDRDFLFMSAVKALPCLLRDVEGAGACRGGVEADHAGERAGWRRAADDTCIPLCNRHHGDRTERRGYFYGWPRDRMRAWCDASITATRFKIDGLRVANF